MTIKTYLDLNEAPGRVTCWDDNVTRPTAQELVLVKLGSGNHALLHPDDLKALQAYIEYAAPDEERNWEETQNEHPTDDVHAYMLLVELTPQS